jgi:two-component system cell cycle sensor histidine kinase/response regulator CckA
MSALGQDQTEPSVARAVVCAYRQLGACIEGGLLVLDRQLRCVVANAFVEVAVDRSEAWLTGRPIEQVPQLARIGLEPMLRGALEANAVGSIELRWPGTEGERWCTFRCAPLHGKGREVDGVDGVVVTLQDVSARKLAELERERAEAACARLEGELRQTQRLAAVGQLASGVAHDFNNVLTAIIGHCDMLLADLEATRSEDESLHLDASQIRLGARRAAALTRQLLTFSRREVDCLRPLNISALVRELEPMLRRLLNEDISLELALADRSGAVFADAGKLEQLVVNLVINARDAMPRGGRIRISCGGVGDPSAGVGADAEFGRFVMLAVEDDGEGMAPEVRERVFEPFFTTKGEGRGTGLGLSTAHRTVKQIGGTISIESEAGRGTTVHVRLPALEREFQAPAEQRVGPMPLGGSETVVVCGDDVGVRQLMTRFMQGAGYEVIVAEQGADALAAVRQRGGAVQLLVTDVVMPTMNGRELSDALHAAYPEIATLFVSGYTADVIGDHGVIGDGVHLLPKPFTRRQLLRRVRDVLDQQAGGSPPRG